MHLEAVEFLLKNWIIKDLENMVNKKQKNSILHFIFICLLIIGGKAAAQNGEISGTISMPAVQKEIRMFRGNLYRNRRISTKTITGSSEILKSDFIDVIISAYPRNFKPALEPLADVKILQKDASFIPRVVPVTPGTVIQFINKDKFFHNVFSITRGATFNIGRRATNVVVSQKVTKLGEIKIFCDIHAQMNAVILSLDTPYFTRVEPNGEYKLGNLPAGTYTIRVYHPDFQEISEVVIIKTGETTLKDFILSR